MEPVLAWLEDPRVFQVNRLQAHSDHIYDTDREKLKNKEQSLKQSLNGTWKFCYSSHPAERPEKFYEENADVESFGTITVPGHIQMQGYDKIHYINTMYPWEGHSEVRPPKIDWDYNPVGSYLKEFDLKEELKGKRICISFQGVEQAVYVWLNSAFIGYSEDSFTPSDFDLTPYIREAGNRLCVEVYKKSSAAWLEDQDFFRFSGIFREVFLYAKPQYHMDDIWVKAGLTEDCDSETLEILAKISAEPRAETDKIKVVCCLKEQDGTTVLEKTIHALLSDVDKDAYYELQKSNLTGLKHWSAEYPNLYELEISIYDKQDCLVEVASQKVGFRRFELKNGIMLLNGERLIVNGVNRHEWNPRHGRAISEEDMLSDIKVLKRNHINAVRTCHYPNQSLWYALCDEYGIYVMDETNLESHGSWQKMGKCEPSWNVPGSLPEWQECVVDRAASMLERDKNHASILWWSCGNESYAGECIMAMSRYFHKRDASRLVHYEGVFWNREFDEISDIESRMYASPEEVRAYMEENPKKPYLLCEYMHDMGNSLGGMESYIRLLDEYPMYQGGFIWDYMDQAIYHVDDCGREVLGYGGDFDDRPSDYAFSGNGIVFADRTEKPAMQEVKYWYATKAERARMDEEKRLAQAEADLQMAGKGFKKSGNPVKVIHGDVMLGVRGEGFHVIFSYQDGGIVSLKYEENEWIYRAPRPAFWRACTENDQGNGFPLKSGVWLSAARYCKCTGWKITEEGENYVSIRYTYETQTVPVTLVTVEYTVNGMGEIRVRIHYEGKKGLPELPLFGIRFILPHKAEKIRWQGLSGETYPDRMAGAAFAIHESGLEIPDYLVPQECCNHMDTRWCQVINRKKEELCGLEICMEDKPFIFSAVPYTAEELENATHKSELPETGRTVLQVLAKMRGVGGIDSWGSDVEAAYRISAEEDIDYQFIMRKAPGKLPHSPLT